MNTQEMVVKVVELLTAVIFMVCLVSFYLERWPWEKEQRGSYEEEGEDEE